MRRNATTAPIRDEMCVPTVLLLRRGHREEQPTNTADSYHRPDDGEEAFLPDASGWPALRYYRRVGDFFPVGHCLEPAGRHLDALSRAGFLIGGPTNVIVTTT